MIRTSVCQAQVKMIASKRKGQVSKSVNAAMYCIMSDSVAKVFSWTGNDGKQALKDVSVIECIYGNCSTKLGRNTYSIQVYHTIFYYGRCFQYL